MFWPMFAVFLGFAGLVVVAVPAVAVYLAVRRLGEQVAESARRVERASADLERAASGVARSARGG
ncbi:MULTISPECIES: hypothetical protein [unclassified Streptomyces]|uniref:hypothetical protein n=1 Tax=unclassified Streptomyces TaxID=2593676 RepID=UPI0019082F70|nr:hypothetical protein [Streptomyces sp. HSG2]